LAAVAAGPILFTQALAMAAAIGLVISVAGRLAPLALYLAFARE